VDIMRSQDERTLSALARLTANEKECLRRRLLPQTAKEMAIDLGISPHAVEKRLKMARAKLGLASSLEAARLLLATEGYGQSGPQASDLATGPQAVNDPDRAGISSPRRTGPPGGSALFSYGELSR
jgi:DNA-binding CsgD family transcriptional regulator